MASCVRGVVGCHALSRLSLLHLTGSDAPPCQSGGVQKSVTDDRNFRYLVLENNLKVVLVSDPNTEKVRAAHNAARRVNVWLHGVNCGGVRTCVAGWRRVVGACGQLQRPCRAAGPRALP
jgi:hypothetical protein